MEHRTVGQHTVLSASEGFIHKIDTDVYARSVVMLPGETVDMYEEVAEMPGPGVSKEAYAAEVERLIAERYSTGKEIELLVERDTDPEAWAEYRAFVADCKTRALQNLESKTMDNTGNDYEHEHQ